MQLDNGQKRVLAALGVLAVVLLAGTLALMHVEGFDFADSLYFSVVTMSTVGYGDVVPHTGAGRVVAGIMILTGVGSFMNAVAAASDHLLTRRAQKERKEKLNMVIGVFFSEAGIRLLRKLALLDTDLASLRARLPEADSWSEQYFRKYSASMAQHGFKVAADAAALQGIKDFLTEKSPLLVRLLENPNLLEHETCTDLLWAVLHIKEELEFRFDLSALSVADATHVGGDLERAYRLLALQWLDYMRHLKANYPYLFMTAAHRNPFREQAEG
ncbi:MAG: potassium channel family protein [Humidesulfovibrio sp.]|uniref:potassium channel family protein n=1 Tax=Humidesulfovibrio sp. TaxID=2910988 RepID=UPI0027F1C6C5|nr:potassium channel family protein [Humidesulfovibrio sp.]MDQ7834226.1 potassium channel family protein [Humidesulfovibrio sp.]